MQTKYTPPRIDCGISVISDEDLRARDIERATLRAMSRLVRRVRAFAVRWATNTNSISKGESHGSSKQRV